MIRVFKAKAISCALMLLLVGSAALGQKNKSKLKLLSPTHYGSTGLFDLALPDTLRAGEFLLGFSGFNTNREPGDLDFSYFPVAATVGVSDRVEFFLSWEAHRRMDADGILPFKTLPGAALQPAQVQTGLLGYSNEAPFADVGFGDGSGELTVGGKINFLSERRGDSIGLAFEQVSRISLHGTRERLARGLTSGGDDFGFSMLFSKDSGAATVGARLGFTLATDADGPTGPFSTTVERQPSIDWGIGLDIPVSQGVVHGLIELNGSIYLDAVVPPPGERNTFINPADPVDLFAGLRAFPDKWITASGGALLYVGDRIERNQGIPQTERFGWFGQLSLQRRINRPPTVTCSSDSTSVTEGQNVSFSADISDSDDDQLDVLWKASGGRLTSRNDTSAMLATAGLDPGRYTVSIEVNDGDNVASCPMDVTVTKQTMAPSVVCEPSSFNVTLGQSTTMTARGSDPNGDTLRYSWSVDGQSVPNDQPQFSFGTAGRAPGAHRVTVTVTDTDSMTASCDFTVNIDERPNRPPSITCNIDQSEVYAGETVTVSTSASDPDNDPLTYAWTVDGQSRRETGSSIRINTGGMAGGDHTVGVRVSDGRGESASCNQTFAVVEKIVVPIDRIEPDNQAKARLDEIALRLQRNPRLQATITGHTDDVGSDNANERVGMRRAEAVKAYLVDEQNVSATRISTASSGESQPIADNSTEEGRRQNRRVEIELRVP